jgi:hypothetical protein
MQLDLFSVPIWIGNIDTKKIKLVHSKLNKPWILCDTQSTYGEQNYLDQSSMNYLLKTIVALIKPYFKENFKVELLNYWTNKYVKNDFQEAHIHANSSLSYIIYQKVDKAHTVFNNPNKHLIELSQMSDFFQWYFEPECRQGQIIIFPSYVEHWVKNNSNSITIAGNLKIEKYQKTVTQGIE